MLQHKAEWSFAEALMKSWLARERRGREVSLCLGHIVTDGSCRTDRWLTLFKDHQSLLPLHMALVSGLYTSQTSGTWGRVWKVQVNPFCFPHNCSHQKEQACIIIQNNDSFQRCKCCGDCTTSTWYDTIFKHSSYVIYALTKSCFQLKDVTLPLKHIWSSHHTKTLQLRCLHAQVQSQCHISSHGSAKWRRLYSGASVVSACKGGQNAAFLWSLWSEGCFPCTKASQPHPCSQQAGIANVLL